MNAKPLFQKRTGRESVFLTRVFVSLSELSDLLFEHGELGVAAVTGWRRVVRVALVSTLLRHRHHACQANNKSTE